MKNVILLLTILQIALTPALAYSQSAQRIVDNPPRVSVQTMQLLGQTYKSAITSNQNSAIPASVRYRQEFQQLAPFEDRSVRVIVDNFQRFSYNHMTNTALEGTKILAKGAIAVGGKVPDKRVKIVGYAVGVGIDKTLDFFIGQGNERAKLTLSDRLAEYRIKTNTDFTKEKAMDPKEFLKTLHDLVPDVLPETRGQDQKDVYQQYEILALKDMIEKNTLADHARHVATQEQIAEHQKELSRLSNFQIEFAKETRANFDSVYAEQKKIWENIDGIKERVKENTQDIAKARSANDAIRMFMMGNMTPDEQLKAVDGGLFPDLDETDKKALKNSIEIQKNSLPRQLEKVLNYASDFVTLGTKLGISPEQMKPVSDAIKYGAAAFNVAGAIASGNYFAAATQILDVFGGGGMDPAAARHAEMMGAFAAVMQMQKQILEELRAGFTAVLKNQKIMMDQLTLLSQQINRQHEELIAELTGIKSVVWANLALTQFLVNREIAVCEDVLATPGQSPADYGWEKGRFKNYSGLEKLLNEEKRDLQKCREGIGYNFGPGRSTPIAFPWQPTQEELDYKFDLRHSVYKPLYDFARTQTVNNLQWALLSPSPNMTELHKKINFFAQEPAELESDEEGFHFGKSLSQLINTAELSRQVGILIKILPWLEVYDEDNNRAFTLNEILEGRSNSNIVRYLNQAINFIDVAIAQHTLISGDVLLPALYHLHPKADNSALKKGADTEEDFLADLTATWQEGSSLFQNLVLSSPVLARNYVIYAVTRDLYESLNKGINRSEEYNWALLERDDKRFKNILRTKQWKFNFSDKDYDIFIDERNGTRRATLEPCGKDKPDCKDVEVTERIHWKQVSVPKGWSVEFYNQFIPMPPPTQLVLGVLDTTSTLKELVGLRARAVEAKAEFMYLRDPKLTPEVQKRISHVFMKGI